MKEQSSSLKLSLRRESKAWRRRILMMFANLNEVAEWNPDLEFRRRQFLYQVRVLKQKKGRKA